MQPYKFNIGVIMSRTESCYFGTLLRGIHKTVQKNNSNLFVINSFMLYRFNSKPGRDLKYFPLAFNHIDGWIVHSQGVSNEYIELICKSGKPIVLLSYEADKFDCSVVQDDNYYGAETITEHLIKHGHKRILFLGCSKIYDMIKRYEGYKNTLEKNGIQFDPELAIDAEEGLFLSGKKSMDKVLKSGLKFTGIFAGNDYLALGAMEAMREAGLRIPEDVAVIGYDNTQNAKSSNPGLSSMSQNVYGIGSAAAGYLLEMLQNNDNTKKDIYIKSHMVLRNSCGCKVDASEEEPNKENMELKNEMINRLEVALQKNFYIGTELLTTSIDEIKKMPLGIIDNYSWGCVGYWKESPNTNRKLTISEVVDIKFNTKLNQSMECLLEDFPPKEILPDFKDLGEEDVVWILPISTEAYEWGVLAYISPFDDFTTHYSYNVSTNLYNFLGIAIDREVANLELKKALENLKETQEQLIQSEKMVSLGGLVAGVAHEINTPVGVSITAASYLRERSDELTELFISGKLKRQDMEKYIDTNNEITRTLLVNLGKASNLINSFKQIAVDQSIEEKRQFKVKEYLDGVLLSLNPKLKNTGINVQLQCPENLEVNTYPGGLYRITTILIDNSITHGFCDNNEGNININVYKDGSTLNFIYFDDGRGISREDIGRIFEPFFTTRRGSGRVGLGLNIVYNLVTHEYGGSIKCESEPCKGATFIIKIPI